MALKPIIAGSFYQDGSLKPIVAGMTRAGGVFRPVLGGFYVSGESGPSAYDATIQFPAGDDCAQSGSADYIRLYLTSDTSQSHVFWAQAGTSVEPTGLTGTITFHQVDADGLTADDVRDAFSQAIVDTLLWTIPGFTPTPPPSGFAFLTSVSAGSSDANVSTTGAIDTTGAEILFAIVSNLAGAVPAPAVTDSKVGNSWTRLNVASQGLVDESIFVCIPVSVGSGHTFTVTTTSGFPSIAVLAFSGTPNATPTDQQATGGSSLGTIQAGSVTPTEDNEIIIAGLGNHNGDTPSINGGFTKAEEVAMAPGLHFGLGAAYLIQTLASAADPTWTVANTPASLAASNATFKKS